MTYEQMCTAAILIHETEYRISGDRYATAEEMDCIRQDPLAYSEQIRDQLILSTGHLPGCHIIEPATAEEMLQAAKSVAKNWAYVAKRADRLEREAAARDEEA